jgi:hypothetical protein
MHVDFNDRRPDFDRENLVMLQNIEVVDPWLAYHKIFIANKYNDMGRQRTDGEIIREHNSTFTHWFKAKLLDNGPQMTSSEEKIIFALS